MWSALAGAGLSLADSFLSQDFQRQLQHGAQDFSAQQFANRYQTTVKDMKAAGLNPMLAYSQGGGSPPTVGAGSGARSDMQGGANQTRLASAQEANIREDTKNKRVTNDQISADTDLKKSSAEMNHKIIGKIEQEIKNLQEENYNIKQQANERGWSAALKSQQTQNEIKQQMYMDQLIKLTTNEVAISEPKARAAATTGAFAAHGENIGKGISGVKNLIPFTLRSKTGTGFTHKGSNDYK